CAKGGSSSFYWYFDIW
nr:immunoglobulin heavy chain junction region [Macaca mulatta]MOX59597.1 immunoglobulin heavy chain junction region [Macaca mulatta]MOX59768.1 immunoglobulin heavy chain junction region [Macaca mulatta]MOX60500.1 immunoglobulin heavy chain junction region [Macaca mulatta]MOX60564.1 immunoglobulin heavy chain junction region [Macaca mulatta]